MTRPIRILFVEDSEDDVWIIIREIQSVGYEPVYQRVDTPADLKAALENSTWDVIISDYKMPRFNAPAALKILKETQLDIPFIVVSGMISEETAVAVMRDGASDYLMKDNLTRLVPALEREVAEAANRQERKRAQSLVLRLGKIMDTSSNEVYIFPVDSLLFTQVNQSASTNLGYSTEALLQRSLLDIQPELNRDKLQAMLDSLSNGDQDEVQFETFHCTSSLETYPVEVRLYLSRTETPPVFVAIVRNISDRKRTENTLRFLTEASTILSSSLDYDTTLANIARLVVPYLADLCVVDIGEGASIRRVAIASTPGLNTSTESKRLYPKENTIPCIISGVLLSGKPAFYAEFKRPPECEASEIIEAANPSSVMFLPLTARDQTFGVLTLAAIKPRNPYTAIDLALGEEVARRVGMAMDNARLYRDMKATLEKITDLYRVSQRVGSKRTIQNILEALVASAHLNLREAQVLSFNRSWLFGKPSHYEIMATANAEGTFPQDVGQHYLFDSYPLAHLLPRENYVIEDNVMLFPIQTTLAWYGILSLHFKQTQAWSQEDIRHIVGLVDQVLIAIDNILLLEAEAKARAEAETANELKLQFLAMISHELRTPLTSIKGFTTTLMADDVSWDEAQQQQFLGVINDETDKLTELIDQLLDLSRLQAGTLRINPEIHPLKTVFDLAMIHLRLLTVNHAFVCDPVDSLPPLLIDPQRIAQVIENLVSNAAKHSPAGTQITVRVQRKPHDIQIDVCDQGFGIPLEEREAIFEPFRQAHQNKNIKGTGLGLAICKGLIEAHGGKIWIQDIATPGTTVSFSIPVVNQVPFRQENGQKPDPFAHEQRKFG